VLEKEEVAVQFILLAGGQVDAHGADDFLVVDDRNTEESRLLVVACLGAVEEIGRFADVRYHLRSSGLGHPAGNTFAKLVLPAPRFAVGQAARGLNVQNIRARVTQGERAAQYTHIGFHNLHHLVQQLRNIVLACRRRLRDFIQNVEFLFALIHFCILICPRCGGKDKNV